MSFLADRFRPGVVSLWLVAALLPAFAIWPVLSTPIEEHAYDAASFHIMRAVVFSDARAAGEWLPRWVMPINDGLGGPLFAYYPPLSYFLMDGLHSVGLPFPLTWRVLVAAALLIGSMGMCGLGLALWRRADVSLLAAAAFIYAPGLLRDLLERGSPQGIALAISPLLLWSLVRLVAQPSGWRFTLAAAGWASLILMHNLAALMLMPVLLVMVGFLALGRPDGEAPSQSPASLITWLPSTLRSARLWLPLAALAVGTFLAAPQVLPYLLERDLVHLWRTVEEQYSNAPEVEPLRELLAGPPLADTGVENNSMGQGAGWMQLLLIGSGLVATPFLLRRRQFDQAMLAGSLAVIWLIAALLRAGIADEIWRALPMLESLGVRWRFLNLTGLLAALAGGSGLAHFLQWPGLTPRRGWVAAVLAGLCLLAGWPLLYPNLLHRYIQFPANPGLSDLPELAGQVGAPGLTLTAYGEFVPHWRGDPLIGQTPLQPLLDWLPEGARLSSVSQGPDWMSLEVDTPTDFGVGLRLMYFPGWEGTIDGNPVDLIAAGSTGWTQIVIPRGHHRIDLRYVGTPAQRSGDWIGLLTLIGLLGLSVGWRSASGRRSDSPQPVVDSPPLWLGAGLAALLLIKGLWLDPGTTFLRTASTCQSVVGAQTVDVRFGGLIRLCGVDFDHGDLHPGQTVRLTVFWQIDRPVDLTASTYVHVLGENFNPATQGPVWAQQDKKAPGYHTLAAWLPGWLMIDRYVFILPPETPPGSYTLEIGWYTPDGARLPPIIQSGEVQPTAHDSLILSTLTVR